MGFDPAGSGGGATEFGGLSDVPGSYTGFAAYVLRVNSSEDGLEFYDAATSGDVVGPSSATDYAFALYDGATGKLLRNSAIVSDVSNNVSGMATLTLPNTGLHLADTDASHDLIVKPGSNLTADRTFTITTGDVDRTLDMGGNIAIGGALTLSGSFDLTLTISAETSLTLPTSGTVATTGTRLDQFAAPTASVSMNSQLITNLATPVSATDAATKAYADAIASGLSVKTSCRVATAGSLSATYAGTPNFTLTANSNGAISIDGISLSLNDRVLVKNQVTGTENGIYRVSQVGDGSTPYILTRATDADSSAELISGTYAFVTGGTANGATGFILTTDDPITLDTTSLSFTQFSAAQNYIAGDGLTLTSLTFAVGAGTGITVNADSIEVDFTAVQALDATLTALAAYNSNGLLTQTAADTFTARTVAAGSGIAVTNGNGVSGNPTIAIDINGLTADSAPEQVDYVASYDTSAGTHKKILVADLKNVISGSWMRNSQVGSSPAARYYSNKVVAAADTTVTVVAGTLYAFPFYVGASRTADRLAVRITTAGAAGTLGAVGIYTNTDSSTIYPDDLVVSYEDFSTAAAGVTQGTISQALTADTLYWLVFLFSGTPTMRAATPYATPSILGQATGSLNSLTGVSTVGYGYAALPATYPAGSGNIATNPILGCVRFS